MREKVVFMIINMNIGGTEKALLNMIAEMPEDQYDITLLMLEKKGGFLDYIPNHVRIECLSEYSEIKPYIIQPPRKSVINLIKSGHVLKSIRFMSIYLFAKLIRNKNPFFDYLLKDISEYKTEFNVAIAYAGPMDFISYFVLHKINAAKKIQWIHFDVTKIGFNAAYVNKLYSKFNHIFTVSEEGKEKLKTVLPSISTKIGVFRNLTSEKTILEMSAHGTGFDDSFSGYRILTVGRLSHEKGQDLIIKVLSNLKSIGIKVRWYCIGEGNARKYYGD